PGPLLTDDDPITLADAAAGFHLTKGVLKAAGLRGNLSMFLLGKSYYTTPNAVREWIQKCRVEPKARGSISIDRAGPGPSATEQAMFARAALRQTLSAPTNSSPSTSRTSTLRSGR